MTSQKLSEEVGVSVLLFSLSQSVPYSQVAWGAGGQPTELFNRTTMHTVKTSAAGSQFI